MDVGHPIGEVEALQTALLVQVATGLIIRVASLAGLALLKLLAWRDRGLEDTRDATDLVTLCRHYAEAGNLDRIYAEALPALQAVDFDVELAGAARYLLEQQDMMRQLIDASLIEA